MGVISIKIKIGEREYPMKVDENEEELLRKAGRLLNEKLKTFKEQYHIEDRQDLLAMVAFDTLVQQQKNEALQHQSEQEVADKLNHLHSLVSKALA